MSEVASMSGSDAWQLDLLDRKPLADHLTASLVNQSSKSSKGITAALDADWGTGKTFFVREWIKDLRAAGHPVVYFDAWESDIGEEASIALMASILGVMSEWKRKIPSGALIESELISLKSKSIKKLRRAVVPIAGVVVKGVVKKAIGVGLEDLVEAISDESENESSGELNEALDRIFEEALKEHDSRQQSLKSFKESLSQLIQLVSVEAFAKQPLFVFVDELDRCRPPYAVKLLEEIKHIFGIPGVVYVVSTNISQLQNSIKAIYGSEFDGRRYLRRLFDREYALPAISSEKFISAIVESSNIFQERNIILGLPRHSSKEYKLGDAWRFVCDGFGFDLRSQKQLLAHIEEASNGLPPDKPLHILWMTFLAALYQKSPESIKRLSQGEHDSKWFDDVLKNCLIKDESLLYRNVREDIYSRREESSTNLSMAIKKYFEVGKRSDREIINMEINIYDYPDSIVSDIGSEFNGSYIPGKTRHSIIRRYPDAILGAGYLVKDEK